MGKTFYQMLSIPGIPGIFCWWNKTDERNTKCSRRRCSTICQKWIIVPKHGWLNSPWINVTYWPLQIHQFILSIDILQIVQREKNIWVSVDSNLSFENHMATKISKAEQKVGLIRKSFLDADLFRRLFFVLVRSNLEYAHPICSTHLKNHIKTSSECNSVQPNEYQERLLWRWIYQQ